MSSPLDPLAAAGLGALQGLTEFLPVSSSGHVAIGAWLFGIDDLPLSAVIVVHAGTLVATLLVVGGDVKNLALQAIRGLRHPSDFLKTPEGAVSIGVGLGSLPTAAIGLLLKERVESWSHVPWAVGGFLLVSAAVVLTTRIAHGEREQLPAWGYVLVGVAQGFAVLPGISRSGSTIAAGMLLGLRAPEAFRFSFLLSLPAVAGAVLLELGRPGALSELGWSALIAGGVACGVGWVALLWLKGLVTQGRLWVFAVYLVPLGSGLMLWSGMR